MLFNFYAGAIICKRSGIPGAGEGLFTRKFIKKGTFVTEYIGAITTWKKVLQTEKQTGVFNQYLYYVNRNYVIDAGKCLDALARYINDASGLTKKIGVINNSKFTEKGKHVFIEALRDILTAEEILIRYGKEYWDIVKSIK